MKKVLIIEDEKPIARAMQLKLQKSGIEAEVAANGQIAMEKLESQKFDLALLDLVMPKVDGFGVLEEIKRKK